MRAMMSEATAVLLIAVALVTMRHKRLHVTIAVTFFASLCVTALMSFVSIRDQSRWVVLPALVWGLSWTAAMFWRTGRTLGRRDSTFFDLLTSRTEAFGIKQAQWNATLGLVTSVALAYCASST
jgi:hypothetical protein